MLTLVFWHLIEECFGWVVLKKKIVADFTFDEIDAFLVVYR